MALVGMGECQAFNDGESTAQHEEAVSSGSVPDGESTPLHQDAESSGSVLEGESTAQHQDAESSASVLGVYEDNIEFEEYNEYPAMFQNVNNDPEPRANWQQVWQDRPPAYGYRSTRRPGGFYDKYGHIFASVGAPWLLGAHG